MCPQRAYGGYPTLVCHLGLKDMQRFRPNVLKTFYLTVPVAGRSPSPQVVAISQKRYCTWFQWPDENSMTYSDYEDDGDDYGRMELVSNSGGNDGALEAARMDTERSRQGNYLRSKVFRLKSVSTILILIRFSDSWLFLFSPCFYSMAGLQDDIWFWWE